MTDNEIIEGLKAYITTFDSVYLRESLDLINRQQAEIDRLNIDLKAMRGAANSWKAEVQRICKKEFDNIEIDIEAVKSEAVREFADKLKPMLSFGRYTSYEQIDNLVKEMGCNDG